MKVTTTPRRPSSTWNSATKGRNRPLQTLESTSLIRSRVDSASRVTVALEHVGTAQHLGHGYQQFLRADIRQQLARPGIRGVEAWHLQVATDPRQLVRSSAAALKRSYSCSRRISSARGSSSLLGGFGRARQQHARLDLGKHGGHHRYSAASSRRTDFINST